MVSAYPPIRDGIGTYAAQEVKALLRDGHEVEVLSPQPSAAHHHLRLRGARGPAALSRRVGAYDRVIVQYHPDVFYPYPSSRSERMAVTSGLLGASLRARNVEFRIHEFQGAWGGRGPHARLLRRLWLSARRLEVHTETERAQFAKSFGIDPERVEVVPHGAHFAARAEQADRSTIRAELGIGVDEFCFASIGFIQPHKGFDRAVRAFAEIARPGTRLDIVGSVRLDEDAYLDYAEDLRTSVADTRGAVLHEGFVSDERFDQWLIAADCLVLPYRAIFSSGVLERARLFGTPVIATRVGGLEEQASEGTTLVDDDAGLAQAMADAAGGRVAAAASPAAGTPWQPIVENGAPDRDAVVAELRRRAGTRAPTARPTDQPPPPGRRRRRPSNLRDLEPFALPAPGRGSAAGRVAKRLVYRLTYWQLAPLVQHVNRLHRAATNDLPGNDLPGDDGS
jgi:glycosyltransferase involved in cell wall biosynthesis